MNSGKFDMFENDVVRSSIDAMAKTALAFNPFVLWSAGAAIGLGALAGLSRAASELTIPTAPVRRTMIAARPIESRIDYGAAKKVGLTDTPVEALARPILNEMIEQAILEEKAVPSKPRTPKAKSVKTGPKRPSGLENPRHGKADNLKSISGIGPKLEMTLNDLGIYHFDQIAAWTRAETDWIDDYLSFKGRVERDRWIEQAGNLSK